MAPTPPWPPSAQRRSSPRSCSRRCTSTTATWSAMSPVHGWGSPQRSARDVVPAPLRGRSLRRHALHADLLYAPRRARKAERRAARFREGSRAGADTALVVLLFALLRRRGARWPLALGLTGAVLASWAASSAVFGVRGDVLAVVLQLGAVALVAERVTTRRAVLAGLLERARAFRRSCRRSGRRRRSSSGSRYGRAARCFHSWPRSPSRAGLLFVAVRAVSLGGRTRTLRVRVQRRRVGPSTARAGSSGSRCATSGRCGRSSCSPAATSVLVLVRRPVSTSWRSSPGCILLVVLRDLGAYENHLLDVSVLAALVVGGVDPRPTAFACSPRRRRAGDGLAARHTLVPDLRARCPGRRALSDAAAAQPRLLRHLCPLRGSLASPSSPGTAHRARRLRRPPARRRGGRRGPPQAHRAPQFGRIVLMAPATDPVQYTELRLHARDRGSDPPQLPARRPAAGAPALGLRADGALRLRVPPGAAERSHVAQRRVVGGARSAARGRKAVADEVPEEVGALGAPAGEGASRKTTSATPCSIGWMSAGTSAGSYSMSGVWITAISPSMCGIAARIAAPLPEFLPEEHDAFASVLPVAKVGCSCSPAEPKGTTIAGGERIPKRRVRRRVRGSDVERLGSVGCGRRSSRSSDSELLGPAPSAAAQAELLWAWILSTAASLHVLLLHATAPTVTPCCPAGGVRALGRRRNGAAQSGALRLPHAPRRLSRVKAPKILAVASAVDLDYRYGCTPAWWQLWKGLYEVGVDLIVTPYRGRPVESPVVADGPEPDPGARARASPRFGPGSRASRATGTCAGRRTRPTSRRSTRSRGRRSGAG